MCLCVAESVLTSKQNLGGESFLYQQSDHDNRTTQQSDHDNRTTGSVAISLLLQLFLSPQWAPEQSSHDGREGSYVWA